jgi:hypothetical protein
MAVLRKFAVELPVPSKTVGVFVCSKQDRGSQVKSIAGALKARLGVHENAKILRIGLKPETVPSLLKFVGGWAASDIIIGQTRLENVSVEITFSRVSERWMPEIMSKSSALDDGWIYPEGWVIEFV